ncbi:restriction endonuclease subunit S [Tropicibacter naphthalenivorans]|uniref:Type I restriction enzyme EcoKI specificity protein n=1 Tax=Tropicibacter naphthalenivorans TaxID=441103 RepID=A0A0P1G3Q1_9RHOB|nr:restriction endonuclease subunit S [Tropicibacter naphthalenivorans]CUH76287.1 Type I restriction enzyme EcoKI specificity protein [Tropicibacter naphthalenivorans]SMC38929.1 type I restriction enzyme, S subunit [Tropicibacter naphthalenivorans]
MSWPLAALDSISEVVRGVTFSKADAESDPRKGLLPVLRAGNIAETLNVETDLVYVDQDRISEKQRLRPKDIVVCTSSGSASVLGKSAMLRQEWQGSFGAFLATVRTDPRRADPDFVGHYLRSPRFRAWASNSAGIGIKNIRASDFKKVEIPLPPLEEQKRIAGILDQAAELCRLRTRALDKLNTLGQAIFHEMFGPLKGHKSAEDVRLARDNAELVVSKLGDQILLQRGYDIVKKDVRPGTVPVISSGGTSYHHDTAMAEGPGVIMGRKGSVGTVHFCNSDYWPHDTTLFVKDFKGNRPRFVYEFLRQFDLQQYEASAANPSLNRNNLHPLFVGWPSVGLQMNFEDRVAEAERASRPSQVQAEHLDALFASLQHRAFRGEL